MRTGTSGISPVAGGAGRSRLSCVGDAIVGRATSETSASAALSTSTAEPNADATSDTGEAIHNKSPTAAASPAIIGVTADLSPAELRVVPGWDHVMGPCYMCMHRSWQSPN